MVRFLLQVSLTNYVAELALGPVTLIPLSERQPPDGFALAVIVRTDFTPSFYSFTLQHPDAKGNKIYCTLTKGAIKFETHGQLPLYLVNEHDYRHIWPAGARSLLCVVEGVEEYMRKAYGHKPVLWNQIYKLLTPPPTR